MKYAYFPGCSAESKARDMHQSTLAVAAALGVELVEPHGWTCCGATAGHQTDRVLAAARAAGLPIPRFLTASPEGPAHRAGRTPDETSHISVSI